MKGLLEDASPWKSAPGKDVAPCGAFGASLQNFRAWGRFPGMGGEGGGPWLTCLREGRPVAVLASPPRPT
jgi:hypothetical protein